MNWMRTVCNTFIAALGLFLGYLLVQLAMNNENSYLIDLREKSIILPFVPGLVLALIGVVPLLIAVSFKPKKKHRSEKSESQRKQTLEKSKKTKTTTKLDLPIIITAIMFAVGILIGLIYVLFIK